MEATVITAPPQSHEVIITRSFRAPRALVFKAFTDPSLIPRWWGPARLTTTVVALEARPGGRWRFLQHDATGNEYGFHGVYHDVRPPERIIQTFEYEGAPGHVVLESSDFGERNGMTTLRQTSVFLSVDDRDAMVRSGMEEGAKESMDRIATVLETLQTEARHG